MPDVVALNELRARLDGRREVLERLRRILVESLNVARGLDEIDADAPLFGTGLGLDSVDAVELIVSLEMEFGLKLEDDNRARAFLRTLDTLADCILERSEGRHVDRP